MFMFMSLPAIKQPSAWIPIAMSITALVILLFHIALYGIAREADEGAVAHIWQLLMAGQLPVILFYAVRWLQRAPGRTLWVLAAQGVAALAAVAPVYVLGL
jgi:hypothetical protein